MVKRRRAAFDRAHALLSEIRVLQPELRDTIYFSPRQLQPLFSLQKLLIKEITRTERKIRRSKAILRTIDKALDPVATSELEDRIEEYRNLSYSWRCFGDGIAYHFMDKFALKQTFYNTHNLNPKQEAGFLSGKEGLQKEWEVMDDFLASGLPAILTDLTNTIRHGDVCVMIGPDPILFEVKLGKLGTRGKRQRNSIRQLMEFYATDETEGLRGVRKMQRVSPEADEVVYLDAINDCISSAMKLGAAWRSPEDGLYYIAIADRPDSQVGLEDVFSELNLNQPSIFILNELKINRAWSPYNPYTLSIRDRDALFQFIWGGIVLVVAYELDALVRLAKSDGVIIKIQRQDSDYALDLSRSGTAGPVRLSRQMFFRLAYDFTSPAWLLKFAIEGLDTYEAATGKF